MVGVNERSASRKRHAARGMATMWQAARNQAPTSKRQSNNDEYARQQVAKGQAPKCKAASGNSVESKRQAANGKIACGIQQGNMRQGEKRQVRTSERRKSMCIDRQTLQSMLLVLCAFSVRSKLRSVCVLNAPD